MLGANWLELHHESRNLNANFSVFSNAGFSGPLGTMYVYKYHKVLIFQWIGNATELPSNSFTFTTVLPIDYRPLHDVVAMVRTPNNLYGYLQILKNGTITINTPAGATRTWTSANAVGLADEEELGI